jgi:hypothetical protein
MLMRARGNTRSIIMKDMFVSIQKQPSKLDKRARYYNSSKKNLLWCDCNPASCWYMNRTGSRKLLFKTGKSYAMVWQIECPVSSGPMAVRGTVGSSEGVLSLVKWCLT